MRRIEQINELLRAKIALAIQSDLELPDILATVTSVQCSPDIKHAKVWISVLPDSKAGSTVQSIKKQEGLIYTYLKKNTLLNKMPKLDFIFDDTQKKAAAIEQVMDNLS